MAFYHLPSHQIIMITFQHLPFVLISSATLSRFVRCDLKSGMMGVEPGLPHVEPIVRCVLE
ncbi:hypothetical protein BDR03DRAFT_940018 [Suillus americanus]|nr:hypothetical protein BDR03DRAFT_940018 [Suillus americanus]